MLAVQFAPKNTDDSQKGVITLRSNEEGDEEAYKVLASLRKKNEETGKKWEFNPGIIQESEFITDAGHIRIRKEYNILFKGSSQHKLYTDDLLEFLAELGLADNKKWRQVRNMNDPVVTAGLLGQFTYSSRARITEPHYNHFLNSVSHEGNSSSHSQGDSLGLYTAQLLEERTNAELIHPDQDGLSQ